MIIKNPLHIPHAAFSGSADERPVEGVAQQQSCNDRENRDYALHSASNTVSNRYKHAMVNTTSYASSSAVHTRTEYSPVRTAVVAFTIAISAGTEIGNSNSG